MKRFLFLTALLLALVRVSFGDNTHGAPNDMKEMGAWLGDLTSPLYRRLVSSDSSCRLADAGCLWLQGLCPWDYW